LEQLSGALCDAVTGNGDSESLLTYLRRRNLFLISLDDEHIWYRYHHLFADLLGNLLRKESSVEQICELHRRASAWYEGHDDLDAAIGHAMQAHDFDRTASLIERAFAEVLSQGHVATLLRWMEALPKEVRLGRSRLCMYLGWSMFLNGQYAQAEQRLRDARKALEAMLPSPERDALRGELGAMLATIATLHQDAPTTMREAQDALAQLPADKLSSRARATRALGIAYGLSGDTDRLVRVCGEAKSLAMAGGNTFLAAEVISRIGFAQVDQGRLRQAVRSYQEIADLVAHPAGFPPACLGYVGLALVSLEWNDLDAVLEYLDQGIELCRRGGIGYVLRPAYCIRAILLQARGDAEGALAAMDQAVQLPGLAGSADAAVQLAQYQVRLHLLRGDVETAARWATGEIGVYRPLGDGPRPFEHLPPVLHEIHQVALARVYLAQGIPNGVMALSDHIYASAHAAGRMARVIEISLLRALALYAQGQLEAALAPLGECLSLAGPEGYVRLFLEAGDAAMALVRLATERGIEETYGRRLLAASGWVEPAHAASPSVPIEPLTRRERQVLQLIGDGFSNQEIADRLVVSLNTIKKHSSNIYGKLGVTSRTQAIVRAQETGIL
jgi:LuxR family maltose regulon positive regulatory protein